MLLKKSRKSFVSLFLLMLFVQACNVTRNVPDGQYLLIGNEIEVNKKASGVKKLNFDTDELSGLIQQKPNKSFLGFIRFGVYINSLYAKNKDSKFRRWLNKNLGTDPEILDPYLVDRSIEQLRLYLNNHGFFYSDIDTSILVRGRKKARVKYSLHLSVPYRINEIDYEIRDTALKEIMLTGGQNSLIGEGQIYNANLLDEERYRITSLLRNEGYYFFSPEFIFYEIDSTIGHRRMNVFQNVQQMQVPSDTNPSRYIERNHRRYRINKLLINPDFNPIRTDTSNMQVYVNRSRDPLSRYRFYYREKLKIRPRAIRNSIFLEPLEYYSQESERNTYKQLSSFPLFGYTSIDFRVDDDALRVPDTSMHYLNGLINLTRRPVQSFSIETEGTTSGGKLGLAGNFVYQNLNIFRGGEVFTIKLTGGVEWQQGGGTRDDVFLFFNTIETGAEASVDFPKFLLPVSQDRIPKTLRPRTTIKTGVNYQNRPDYERYVTNVSFGYNWRARQWVTHSLIPIEINSVSIFPDSAFIQRLEDLNDPRLTNQYTDHFIMAAKYSYIFNNQERNKVKDFMFFRWNLESAGNVLGLAQQIAGSSKDEKGQYTVWNIPYSQYVRTDVDFRYYFALNEENTLVYRNLFGIGVPYGNSEVLPFEKGFYAGGASDMRGWRYRSLGPGSFSDTTANNFEKMGDLILEANLEYRFPVYSFVKGAIFADFGNIWLLEFSENYPGGKFDFGDVLSEVAIDGGVGIRFDFSFFIFRIDGAVPLRDPAYPVNDRWRLGRLQLKNVIWNFGIGYPF